MTHPPKRASLDDDSISMDQLADDGGHLANKPTGRKKRTIWSREETLDMLAGCEKHGIGNWKKILDDPTFGFDNRSAVDLKDRYRSYIKNPKRVFSHEWGGKQPEKAVAQRRRKRLFTTAEDDRLLKAFELYGPAWAKIQRDSSFNLSHRKSTDLRDHFRHAFPEKYTAAGLKQHDTKNTPSSVRKITRALGVPEHGCLPRFLKEGPLCENAPLSNETEPLQRGLPSLDSLINMGDIEMQMSPTPWPF